MKFRFCGDQDCPDWILSEVAVLAKMSSVRMLLICRQVKEQLMGNGINHEKLEKLTTGKRLNFEPSDIKAMIAALHYILFQSSKFNVDGEDVLPMELQQLGLPRDVSKAICKQYLVSKDDIQKYFETSSLSLARPEAVDWRVDYLLASSDLEKLNEPTVRLHLRLNRPPVVGSRVSVQTGKDLAFEVSSDKFRVLHSELKAARVLMESLS